MEKLIYVFTAVWCGGCIQVKPILKKLKNEGYNIVEVDAESDEGTRLRKIYGFQNLPTVITVDPETGAETGRLVNRSSEEQYRELFDA